MPREDGFGGVNLKEDLLEEVDDLLKRIDPQKKKYDSRADFIKEAVKHLIAEETPRFTHVNVRDDSATIIDWIEKDYAVILFRENGNAWCDKDNSDSCAHITYALTVPEIMDKLKEKGWKKNVQ